MHKDPSSLDTRTLAACLRASAGEERDRQVDFLLYLVPFDSREAWREAGYGSLWAFCLGELHLREGAAGRRIGAMRVLRDFPGLEVPLRDGRLSLTTAVTLRPLLTRENLEEMVTRAANKTDEETRELVASLMPRPVPRGGIRRLPEPAPRLTDPAKEPLASADAPVVSTEEAEPLALSPQAPPRPRPSLEPVSAGQWSLRIAIDKALKEDLETLRCLGEPAAALRGPQRPARGGGVRPRAHDPVPEEGAGRDPEG